MGKIIYISEYKKKKRETRYLIVNFSKENIIHKNKILDILECDKYKEIKYSNYIQWRFQFSKLDDVIDSMIVLYDFVINKLDDPYGQIYFEDLEGNLL